MKARQGSARAKVLEQVMEHQQKHRRAVTNAISEPTSIEDVLRLAARGWKIHPCTARGKMPLTKWKNTATCEASIIERWSITHRDCNWAVATGIGSGVWVLDSDGDEGRASLDEF